MIEPITIIILSVVVISGNLMNYLLNSRCATIDGCGCHLERDVIPSNQLNKIETTNPESTNLPTQLQQLQQLQQL